MRWKRNGGGGGASHFSGTRGTLIRTPSIISLMQNTKISQLQVFWFEIGIFAFGAIRNSLKVSAPICFRSGSVSRIDEGVILLGSICPPPFPIACERVAKNADISLRVIRHTLSVNCFMMPTTSPKVGHLAQTVVNPSHSGPIFSVEPYSGLLGF